MILKRFAFFLLLSLVCLTQGISQQTYPIQVNVHLLPPYSLYLSDYYSGTREKLTVTLINRDQLKPTVNVKLRMIITAPGGIRIQTNDNAYFQPVIVESGSPVRLTQDDLAQYFQPANLITQGYLTAGKLPEGMVEFCFQAIEAYTGQVLSVSTCTRAWITSQKPPLLSLPRNKESIAFRDPLNVLFQWTPLHQGLGLVEYDFILKELWDNGMTPQAAFAYSPEIYRETTQSTSIIYGAMQPPLLAGKRYAWCVRAKAREGLDEVNLFQNDGYSEIRWFTLQDNCAPPQYVQAATERKRINLEWNTLPEYIGFTVSYRLKSNADQPQAEWKELQLQDTKATLYGLQSGGTYEYRVASMCMTGQPVYTPVFTITVPMADSTRLAQCGILPAVNLTNQEPIKELKTAEVFKAGDFPITIVSISGANGNFSGQGWTIIPWLNDAKIAVEFKSITINTDRQMTNGIVEAKYDKNEGQIANLDDVFEGGFDVGNVKTGLTQPDYKFDFSIPGVDAFALNDNGELVITDDTGEPHTVTAADKEGEGNEGNKVVVFPMTVQDKDGNVYSVEKETKTDANGKTTEVAKATYLGKVGTPLAAGSFDPTQLNGDKAIVTFTKGSGKYTFDTWKEYYDKIALIQDKYQKLYTNYYAPWKFLPSGQTDKVSATIEIKDETIKPELVIFKTPTGTEYEAVRNDKTYTLQVASGPEGDVQELYALYPRENGKYYTLGKLGIATYAPQNYNVVLVAVDNAYVNYEKIEQTLKETYDSVGVTWTVSRDAFAYNASELMKNSTGLSTYNDAMRDLNNAYRAAHPDFNSNSNYLFFLKATGNTDEINNRDLTGFMPRGAQFGYIFTSEVKDADEPITVAHELGHGRWKLYHPFDKHYGGFDEAKQTNNLLAYGNGSHIAKWQWDQMNDPAMLVSVFEGDDASAYRSKLAYRCIPASLTKLSSSEYYYNLDGKVILLNNKYEPYAFVGSDDSNGNKKGALAIIKRKSDGKLYFPAKDNEKYSLYYARTSPGNLDINDKFADFIEDNTQTPTVVLINSDGSYIIKRAGSDDVVGKQSKCNCFDNGSGDGSGSGGKVINYASSILTPEQIQEAIKGLTTSNGKGLNATIYITDDNTETKLIETIKSALASAKNTEAVLWINIRQDKSIELKDFKIGEDAIVDRNGKNISSSVKKLFSLFNDVYIRPLTFNPLTAILDGLGSLIKELEIPEKYWNPEAEDYSDVFLTIFKYTRAATSLGTSLISSEIPVGKFTVSQLEFAATCGFYNSLIETVAGLPEGVSFIIKLITNEDDTWTNFKQMFGQIQSYCGKSNIEVYIAIPEVQVYGYAKCAWPLIVNHFTEGNACQISYKSGGAVFQVVTLVIAFAKAGALARITEVLDLLDPFSLAMKGVFKIATPLVRAGKNLYKIGKQYITIILENGKYVLKLAKESGEIINDIDWSTALHWAELTDEFGNKYKVGLLLDDTEFKAALKRIDDAKAKLKIAKDANNVPLVSDGNYGFAEIPSADANGDALVGIVEDVNKVGTFAGFKNISKLPDNILSKLKGEVWADDILNKLDSDLADDVLRTKFSQNGDLVDSWKVFNDANLTDAIRQNPANLESLSKALKQNGYSASYFENLLKSKTDPQKFIDDYVSRLGKDGNFVDNTLESDYASYVSRKAKEGKPPRDRADWNEASDYMKYNSPTARGNNFNKKAWDEEWYPYWEVYLDNGKYLDGYNPLTKEIVSRKATDLIDISEATFGKYLDEILEKYAPPRIIKSKKPGYENLFNKPLPSDAKLILEIPESNKTFFDIDRYISIAEKKGITIKYKHE